MRWGLWLAFLAGCPATDADKPGGGESAAPTGPFCAVVAVFNDECVVCHDSVTLSGGLDLKTDPYAAIVNVASHGYSGRVLVVPGDPASSFLYLKMTGQQGLEGGDEMPPGTGSSAQDANTIEQWIRDGAPSGCDGGGGGGGDTTPGTRYHPEGYGAAEVHGIAAKYQQEDCRSCHGSNLEGEGDAVSCDSCHEDGWRTNCTYCHGGTDNTTGAPPVEISNETSPSSFPPHTAHVTENIKPGYDCVQCHKKPTDVLSEGHVFVGDTTPGEAEAVFSGGIAAATVWDGSEGCSNNYCHGNGQGDNGTMLATAATPECGSCHPVAGVGDAGSMSGEHSRHVGKGLGCEECHAATVAADNAIIGPTMHVNGAKDTSFPSGMVYEGGQCTGTCHGEGHSGRSW
jgi:predicted CxxxxCH...CXXCH cytochrome family protein